MPRTAAQGASRKCAFLTWVGPGVAGMKRARVAMHKAGVYKAFEGLVADVAINDAADDTLAVVLAKLAADAKVPPAGIRLHPA